MAAFEMMPPCSLATRASIPDEHQALSRRTALTLTHPIGTLPGGVVLVEAVDGEGATMLVELEPRLTESLAADRNADGRVRLRPEPGSMRRLPARRFSRASCGDSRTTSTTAGRAGISSAADLPPGGCSLLPETDPDGAICTQPISTIPSVPKPSLIWPLLGREGRFERFKIRFMTGTAFCAAAKVVFVTTSASIAGTVRLSEFGASVSDQLIATIRRCRDSGLCLIPTHAKTYFREWCADTGKAASGPSTAAVSRAQDTICWHSGFGQHCGEQSHGRKGRP